MNDWMTDTKIDEHTKRWKRLNQLLSALTKQRDEETRIEEKIRLEQKVADLEIDRHEVEIQLEQLQNKQNFALKKSTTEKKAAPPQTVTTAASHTAIRLFYSYSHKDEQLRNELDTHLSILKRQGIIDSWHDRKITPGAEWKDEIDQRLLSADIILLLISPDFIASDYCWGQEMQQSMERHASGDVTVIPIMLRDVDWQNAPFSCLQALPRNAKPITQWEDRDQAYAEICRTIRSIADKKVSSIR